MTYQEQLIKWVKKEQKKGLQKMYLSLRSDSISMGKELFCKEILEAIHAREVPCNLD